MPLYFCNKCILHNVIELRQRNGTKRRVHYIILYDCHIFSQLILLIYLSMFYLYSTLEYTFVDLVLYEFMNLSSETGCQWMRHLFRGAVTTHHAVSVLHLVFFMFIVAHVTRVQLAAARKSATTTIARHESASRNTTSVGQTTGNSR